VRPLLLLLLLLQMPFDLFNYLLRQRIIFLAGYVNDKVGGQPGGGGRVSFVVLVHGVWGGATHSEKCRW
jgi:hypothetical protein